MDPRSKNIIADPVYRNRTEYIVYKNRIYRNIFVKYYESIIIARYSGRLRSIKNKVVEGLHRSFLEGLGICRIQIGRMLEKLTGKGSSIHECINPK